MKTKLIVDLADARKVANFSNISLEEVEERLYRSAEDENKRGYVVLTLEQIQEIVDCYNDSVPY